MAPASASGCIPTKAWVQTAHALHDARETFAKLGVGVSEPQLDFTQAAAWKDGVVKQMTGGVASLFKAYGVEWVRGKGRFTSATTIAVEGGEDVTFKSAIVATGSYPVRPPIPGLDSPRCVDSTGLLAQTEVPRRLVVLGGGIIGCEFASIFAHFGSEVTIIEMLPTLIPQEDEDAAKELRKAFKKRGIDVQLEKQCTGVEDKGDHLVVSYGDGESRRGRPHARLGRPGAARRRGSGSTRSASRPTRARASPPTTTCARRSRRSTPPVTWPDAGSSPTPAFREGEIAAENAMGHEAALGSPAVPRPIYTDPEIAGVGLTEAQAREQYGDAVAVGVFPWVANARAVMSGTTAGWVKSIHETTYGELLGIVIVGPHATDLIEAGVVAIDSESTVETVADGIAPHPTLSEAIKEAGLVALGRAIHLPPKRR